MKAKVLPPMASVLFLLFSVLFWPVAAWPGVAELRDDTRQLPLGSYLQILRDPEGSLSLDEVLRPSVAARFAPSTQPVVNMGFDRAPFWYRVELRNAAASAPHAADWIVELAYSPLDDVRFYLSGADGDYQEFRSGDSLPFSTRRIRHRHLLLPVELPVGGTRTLLIRANTDGPHNFPLTLWRSDVYFEHSIVEYWALGLFYGIMAVMIFYNLFVYAAVRDVSYLYYIGFIFSVVLMQSSLDGTGPQFAWGDWPAWSNVSPTVAVSLIVFSALAFTRVFLETALHDARLDRVLQGFQWIAFAMPWSLLLMPYAFNLRLNSLLALFLVVICIAAALRALARGHGAARLYLFGWGFFLASGSMRVLYAWGVLAASALVEYAMQVGLVMIVVLFALALGDRINALRQERTTLARQRQLAEASTQAKSEFLAKMSHELRTPMNAVIGFNELAIREKSAPRRQQYLEHIRGASRSLLGIINDILDISKIEAGKLTLETRDFALAPLLDKLRDMFKLAASQKSLRLSVSADPRLPAMLNGDPLRLEQVLINLLNNAVKFTERGEVELRAAVVAEDAGHCTLEFSVRDTGAGIASEQAQQLFTPFTQADNSITRRYGGTGLGLAICKQLVEMMGGQIRMDSQPGSGSRFHFTARFARAAADASADAEVVRAARTALRGRRLLLVEDNPLNQMLAAELLRGEGAEVDVAEHGVAALEAVARQPYDLVLMDMQMPVMDGLEATRRLRSDARHAHLPVLAMTANAMEHDRQRCLDAGMNDFISKPIDFAELDRVLARWLPATVPA